MTFLKFLLAFSTLVSALGAGLAYSDDDMPPWLGNWFLLLAILGSIMEVAI